MISEKIMGVNRFIKILSVLMFVLSLCMKLTSVSAAEVRCIDRERQALLKFKHDLVDDYGILSSWGSEEVKKECCKWKGISCSKGTGHVVLLDLNVSQSVDYFYLKAAKLSLVLLELQHLNYLDLSHNDLEEVNWLQHITRLPFLEELYLSSCQLPSTVPSFDIFTNSSLPYLSILDLSFNDLTSSFAFHWLFNSSASLTSIDLSYNRIKGPIPDADGELIFLQELVLSYNVFRGMIPKSLGNLSHLYSLDMSYNELNGPLPNFTKISSLRNLILNNNKLNGFHPQSLGLPSSLEMLELSCNQFRRLPEGIEKLSKLTSFGMSSNLLNGFHPQSLGLPSSLQSLELSYNQFRRLPDGIEKLSKLEYLGMSSNLLEGTIAEWYLSNLANLQFLDLSFNS
ncbi:probably inactive leucine-rich repeat receptor-like protein kinase IMK2 [Olea europaea var. sylvestris]|uniref:probably inactive leucine-rich repeat receptor-like protein kinase IMK2 n=1 Tax=Olea europaea var. sylvestris TaxID=158386 RepID=UPI000C1D3E4F|nr:probably inactive leucine-rich repeat receptor-like protein kinase IMK2 [Olea europaea var. sylvestris]